MEVKILRVLTTGRPSKSHSPRHPVNIMDNCQNKIKLLEQTFTLRSKLHSSQQNNSRNKRNVTSLHTHSLHKHSHLHTDKSSSMKNRSEDDHRESSLSALKKGHSYNLKF